MEQDLLKKSDEDAKLLEQNAKKIEKLTQLLKQFQSVAQASNQKLAQLKGRCADLEAENERLQHGSEVKLLQQQRVQGGQKCAELEQKLLEKDSLIESLQLKNENLLHSKPEQEASTDVTGKDADKMLLHERVSKLKNLLSMANKHINDNKKVVQTKNDTITKLQKDIQELKEELAQSKQQDETMQVQNKKKLQAYKRKVAQAEKARRALAVKFEELSNEFNSYKKRAISALRAKESQLEQASDQQSIAKLQEELEDLRDKMGKITAYNQDLEAYQKSSVAMAEDLKEAQNQKAALFTKLNKERDRFRKVEREYVEEVESLQRQLEEQAQKHSEEIIALETSNTEKFEQLRQQVLDMRPYSTDPNQTEAGERRTAPFPPTTQAPPDHAAVTASEAASIPTPPQAVPTAAQTAESSFNQDSLEPGTGMDRSEVTPSSSLASHSTPAAAHALTIEEAGMPGNKSAGQFSPPSSTQAVVLAEMQHSQNTELSRARLRIQQLTDTLREKEEMERLRVLQEKTLKETIREMERSKTRESANLEYLKNAVVKLLETNDFDRLLTVLSTILAFTPEEIQRIKAAKGKHSVWSIFGR